MMKVYKNITKIPLRMNQLRGNREATYNNVYKSLQEMLVKTLLKKCVESLQGFLDIFLKQFLRLKNIKNGIPGE